MFHRAIDLDPSYAAAYAALGLSLIEAVASGWTEFAGDALGRAEALADRALEINPYDAESFSTRGAILVWGGRAAEALPWFEGALRLDRANARAAFLHGMAYYFVDRHGEAVEAMHRGLAGNLGRTTQLMGRPVLAAAYARLDRQQDADRERAVVMRMAPFLKAERFARQFGTQAARDHMLEGLKKAGFH
jgi:adenylate cyclase